MSDKFESIHRGLENRLPKWANIMILMTVVAYFKLDDFLKIDATVKGKTVGRILRIHGLIEPRGDHRFVVSVEGRQFIQWAIETGRITRESGTDFVIEHSEWLGRRLDYEALFPKRES